MSNNGKPNVLGELRKQEQEFLFQVKEAMMEMVSVHCIDKLKDFNNCRDTGIKKDEKLKPLRDEEVKYYEITKGCFDEYEEYINCVNEMAKQIADSKNIKPLFTGRRKTSFNRSQFIDIITQQYKLI